MRALTRSLRWATTDRNCRYEKKIISGAFCTSDFGVAYDWLSILVPLLGENYALLEPLESLLLGLRRRAGLSGTLLIVHSFIVLFS
jgi:hypothetical protein